MTNIGYGHGFSVVKLGRRSSLKEVNAHGAGFTPCGEGQHTTHNKDSTFSDQLNANQMDYSISRGTGTASFSAPYAAPRRRRSATTAARRGRGTARGQTVAFNISEYEVAVVADVLWPEITWNIYVNNLEIQNY